MKCSQGVAQVELELEIPVIFKIVLTTDTIEQAIERAGTKAGNKVLKQFAVTAIEMVNLFKTVK